MKKLDFLKSFLMLVFIAVGFNTAIAQETLASWTFIKWAGGGAAGVPTGQLLTDPIYADEGLQAATAKIGTENMFADGEGGTVRPWGSPSTAGYVRAAGMVVGTYYRIIGISTVGFNTIKVTAGYASDSSTRYYYLQMQYRKNSNGTWTSLGDPVYINVVSEANIPVKFDNVQLPVVCENLETLELRFLVTALAIGATTTQSRMDNVLITGTKVNTGTNSIQKDIVKVFNANGKLAISGAAGSNVKIYNLAGAKVMELPNVKENETISLSLGQIYIVKVNDKAFKVNL